MDDEIYEVQYIYGARIVGNKTQYLVKWKDYPKSQSTWEPSSNLGTYNMGSARRCLREFDYFIFQRCLMDQPCSLNQHYQKDKYQIFQYPSKKNFEKNNQQDENILSSNNQLQQITLNKNEQLIDQPQQQQNVIQKQPLSIETQQIIENQLNEQQIKESQNSEIQSTTNQQSNDKKKQVLKQNIKNDNLEWITTQEYATQIKQIINNLPQSEKQLINHRISQQENECNQNIQSFEFIFQLIVLDYEKQHQVVMNKLKTYQKQKQKKQIITKIDQSIIQEQKKTNKIVKEQEKQNNSLQLQYNIDQQKNEKQIKRKLLRKINYEPTYNDFIATKNEQIGFVDLKVNEEYGQIGFQKGIAIHGHTFCLCGNEDGKLNINLFFQMQFQNNQDGTQPLFNFVSKSQCILYEKDLLMNYVQENQTKLPDLYKELFG